MNLTGHRAVLGADELAPSIHGLCLVSGDFRRGAGRRRRRPRAGRVVENGYTAELGGGGRLGLGPGIRSDFVVLFAPDPPLVRDLTTQGLAVAALLDRRAPTADVVDVLEAGASVCLCDHDPRLLASYLSQRWM